jgi:nucleoside-diphosphate-sugar epimerase
MNILLTGYTGNLGPEIARRLSEHRIRAVVRDPKQAPPMDHVEILIGDLEHLPESATADTEIIIHAAANTAFRAPLEQLRHDNVRGTQHVLDFAGRCPRLQKLVHVSTACVCGASGGEIPEASLPRPASFVNSYEESKWEAEQCAFSADLPAEVVRLSIVAGSEHDGVVRRLGALQHALFWLWKGLIPMMPGTEHTAVDLISTEYAAAVVAACAEAPLQKHRVLQGCAGDAAPPLGELIAHLTRVFSDITPAWAAGNIVPPAIVDAETFAMFEASVMQSGDALFLRVCEDAKSFMPGLLHPRRHLTANADTLCAAPRAEWKSLAELVSRHVIASRS